MLNTQLYIEGIEVELTEDTVFAITKQFSDLQEPTDIINDWTKTVSIPGTVNNNKLFDNLFRADRNNSVAYLTFDPNKKLDMKLVYNADLLMSGYAKVTKVSRKSGTIQYELNLFGELGKVFGEMNKITFYPADASSGYYIDGEEYVNKVIDKQLIYECWNNEANTDSDIDDCNWYDIVGFSPLNTFYTDYDAKTYQTSDTSTLAFSDDIKKYWEDSKLNTDIDIDSIIGDGLTPLSFGDFRSYYQQPYIFFSKFYEMFKRKFEEKTDYTLNIDTDWKHSPYFKKLVFLANSLYNKEEDKLNIASSIAYTDKMLAGLSTYILDPEYYICKSYDYPEPITDAHYYNEIVTKELRLDSTSPYVDTTNNSYKLEDNYSIRLNGTLTVRMLMANAVEDLLYLRSGANSQFSIRLVGQNGHIEDINTNILSVNTVITDTSHYTNLWYLDNAKPVQVTPLSSSCKYWDVDVNYSTTLQHSKFGGYVKMYITYWFKDSLTLGEYTYPFTQEGAAAANSILYVGITEGSTFNAYKNESSKRTGDNFSINNIWDNNIKPFGLLINYCKMFGLVIEADNVKKEVNILPRHKFFTDYQIEDWSNKIDYDKDYEIKPATYEHKWMVFNYDENETTNGKRYSDKYGIQYGAIKVDTGYAFDSDYEDLFEGLKNSITYTPTTISYSNLKNQRFVFNGTNIVLPYLSADRNEYAPQFGSFYFYKGIRDFDKNIPQQYISDDTELQDMTGTYMYAAHSLTSSCKATDKYPFLDIIDNDNNLCIFNTPKEIYDTTQSYANSTSIYNKYWKKWIGEIYNNNNIVLTCYIKLYPSDFANFRFNHFVTIDNTLYMVNKIYDYSPKNITTKVDLIQISDISAYTE